MKVIILAGGNGSRLSEETHLKPKPMIEIGDMPILWHIMKIYSSYGFNDFIICLGYKGYVIKEFFANYFMHRSDVMIDLSDNSVKILNTKAEAWKITLLDTGVDTLTGGRIKQCKKYIGKDDFMLTYGDGVGDINIPALIQFHKKNKKLLTVTAVSPLGRFGALKVDTGGKVSSFLEKPAGDGSWINGGFFVCNPKVLNYIEGEDTIWEREPLEKLAAEGQMSAYKHTGFWKPMDTLRDKAELEKEWGTGKARWKIW